MIATAYLVNTDCDIRIVNDEHQEWGGSCRL